MKTLPIGWAIKVVPVSDGEIKESFFLSLPNRDKTNLKRQYFSHINFVEACNLRPREEMTHSFVIVEDAPSLLKLKHTYATWMPLGVMFSRVWVTWSLPQKNHRGSVWLQELPLLWWAYWTLCTGPSQFESLLRGLCCCHNDQTGRCEMVRGEQWLKQHWDIQGDLNVLISERSVTGKMFWV